MLKESKWRNRGKDGDEDELVFQETEDFKHRVQKKIDELQKVKEALE